MSSYAFPVCSSAANSWAVSRMTGSFRSSFSSVWISFPFRRSFLVFEVVAFAVTPTLALSSVTPISAVSAIFIGASFTKPRPSFLSRHRLFGRGLSWQGSSSHSAAGSLCVGRSSAVAYASAWEVCGSSSHSVVANTPSPLFADRGPGEGWLAAGPEIPCGGNSTERYCWIIGRSFFPD